MRASRSPTTFCGTSQSAGAALRNADAGAGLKRGTFEVRIGKHAEADLVHVAAWFAAHNQLGIDSFFNDVEAAGAALSMFPVTGRRRDEIRPGLRSAVVHPYLVFYAVNDVARVVMVVRVIHGGRDFGPEDFDV